MSLIVADIGNSRIKWGRCSNVGVDAHVSLPSNDPGAWLRQWHEWSLSGAKWAVASVDPRTRNDFVRWLGERSHDVRIVDSFRDMPIEIAVDFPERVGLDRLLDAVAANRRRAFGQCALVVDAGSAVTVDLLDANGVFRGGAIFPGLRLMAKALADYTAQLPFVSVHERRAPPGTATVAAIETGIFHATVGGIDRLLDDMHQDGAAVFITGGDAVVLAPHLRTTSIIWPDMTLEGIRLVATR